MMLSMRLRRAWHVIDAGHYGLEHIFVPFMAEYVARVSDGTIEVIQAEPDFPARVF